MPRRAWKDTRSWLLNSLYAWVVVTLGGGGVSALIIAPGGASIFLRFGLGVLGAAITIIAILSITYLVHMPITLHRQRNEARKDVNSLEEEREPNLIVEQDTAVCNHKLGYSWRIKVTNKGIDTAKGCKGQLIVMVDEIPQPHMSWERWPFNESLNWSDGKEVTEIRKETKELEVIYGGGYGKPRYLAYAKDEAFREQYALQLWSSNILLVISISSDGKLPVYAVCRFLKHCDTFKHLEILAITSERPDITSYQRQDSYNGDSQT
jgi:hypothetical protein